MPHPLLSTDEVATALATLPAWQFDRDGKAIRRVFVFRNFSEAFAFMTRVALLAEASDHHPEWSNVYKTVDVTLTTHDAGGITPLDVDMARRIDRFVPMASGS